ncbi:MAG: oligosaccharide flippase family protein [Myxococcales bacterium]|nr:oligosaccharide flippase family protein [Myxococcales bacterium]
METRRPVPWLVAGRLGGQVGTFLIPVVLARVLGTDDFGAYRQLFLVFGSLYLIAQLGFAESLYYFLPRAGQASGRYVGNALTILAGAGLCCALALTLGARPLAALLGNARIAAHLPAIGVFLFCMLCSSVLEIVLVSERRFRTAAGAYCVSDLARAVLLVAPAALVGSVSALLVGAVAFAVLRLLVTLVVVGRRYRGGFRLSRPLAATQFRYTFPFALAVVIDTVQAQAHLYVVSNQFDVATFAIYSVACFQIPLVDYVATAAGNVLMVRMGQSPTDRPLALGLWRETTARLAYVLVPLLALIVALGPDLIVFLFGTRYAASGPLFVLASLPILCACLPSDSSLRAAGDTWFLLVQGLLRLVAAAVLLALLFGPLGLVGAVVSTIGAAAVAKVAAVARVAHHLAGPLGELLPWGRLLATLGASAGAGAAAFVLASAAANAPRLARLAASGTVFLVVYLALGARLGLGAPVRELYRRCGALLRRRTTERTGRRS